jgi:hypothetical protein
MTISEQKPAAAKHEPGSVEAESMFHKYRGNQIPWYVRIIWLGFWILAVTYTIRYLFPALQSELFPRP